MITLKAISSMATKAVLARLAADFAAATGIAVQVESVGGVDAAKRVAHQAASGEVFDVVLLGSDAIDTLITAGHLAAPRVDWVRSPVAVAAAVSVPTQAHTGAALPDISSEAALKAAVQAAPSIGYSTGPSGVYLEKLFARWGMAEQVAAKLITPPPGTPVAAHIASGQVALGFQQRSELLPEAAKGSITLLGNLSADVAYITTFSGALPVAADETALDSDRYQAAQQFLAYLQSDKTQSVKEAQGMF